MKITTVALGHATVDAVSTVAAVVETGTAVFVVAAV